MTILLTIVSLFFVPALYFIWQDIKTRTPTSNKIVTNNQFLKPTPSKPKSSIQNPKSKIELIQNPKSKIQNRTNPKSKIKLIQNKTNLKSP